MFVPRHDPPFRRLTRRIFDLVALRRTDQREFLSRNELQIGAFEKIRVRCGIIIASFETTYTATSSEGSLPLTRPRTFCLSGGTFVKEYSATFRSNTLTREKMHSSGLGSCVYASSHSGWHINTYLIPRCPTRMLCRTK